MAGDSSYNISVDLSELFGSVSGMADAVFPMIGQAVRAVAEEGAFRWKSKVMKARLWQGEKEPYVESIKWEMTGPWSASITTDYPLAQQIETGRPAKDLKVALQTSKKTRSAKSGPHKGQRYLIIPFRHNTPTSSGEGALAPQMPNSVYAIAKKLAPSKVLAPGSVKPKERVSASGHIVPQHSYSWGGRLPAGLTPKLKPTHKTDIHAGMVRFDTSSGDSKSSSYLTFRVMGEWSHGWIVGPRPGLFIARDVSDGLQSLLEEAVGMAVSPKFLGQ